MADLDLPLVVRHSHCSRCPSIDHSLEGVDRRRCPCLAASPAAVLCSPLPHHPLSSCYRSSPSTAEWEEDGSNAATAVLLAVGGWINTAIVLVKGTLPPPVDAVLTAGAIGSEEEDGLPFTIDLLLYRDLNQRIVPVILIGTDRPSEAITEKSISCRLEDNGGAPKLVLRRCTERYLHAVEFGPSVVHRTE
ncbi:hypothetical protein ACLOJK_038876 [Asimina triloba]